MWACWRTFKSRFCRTVPVIYLGVFKDTIKDDYDIIKELLGEDMPNKRVYDDLKSSGNSYWNNLNVDIKRRLDLR